MLLQLTIDLAGQAEKSSLSGSANTFGGFVTSIMEGVLAIGAILLLLYLVWAGIEWITAAGDSGKVQKARDKITQSVVGLIVLASAWALFMLLQNFLGIQVLDPSGTSRTSGGSLVGKSSSSTTCASGVSIGQTASDGGVGGYCTDGGNAVVKCMSADEHLPYTHFDPCYCKSGEELDDAYDFGKC